MSEQSAFKEGTVPFYHPTIDQQCFTYYKLFGDLSTGVPPLICLHGGPGGGHGGLIPFGDLWSRSGIPVILYDQVGCGKSTQLPGRAGDKEFWVEPLFIDELNNLIDHLKLRDGPGFNILGHSWGTMLGVGFAATQPTGLKRLILANGAASGALARKSLEQSQAEMPEVVQDVIRKANETKDFDSQEYFHALHFWLSEGGCRLRPWPKERLDGLLNLRKGIVYQTMFGPATTLMTGTVQEWTWIPRLHLINVPTLVYSGEYDNLKEYCQAPYFDLIPRVRWITFRDASHSAHWEQRDKVLGTVSDFLAQKTGE